MGPEIPHGGRGTQIIDLRGQRFGKLTVKYFGGLAKGMTYWCCLCECGQVVKVNGWLLKAGKTVSCGCWKSSSQKGKEAYAKHPIRPRATSIEAVMRARRDKPVPSYALHSREAADMLDVSQERIAVMVQDKLLPGRYKPERKRVRVPGDRTKTVAAPGDVDHLFVSKKAVMKLVRTQERNRRHCRVLEEWMLSYPQKKPLDETIDVPPPAG